MRKLAICDDSKEWLKRASEIIDRYLREHSMDSSETDTEVLCYNDIDECIEELPADVGVLFMDIEWEEGDLDSVSRSPLREQNDVKSEKDKAKTLPKGIEAAGRINTKYPNCRIVYLTNHLGYALDVYQTEHAWYVLKEQFEERLPEVFEKLENLEEEARRSIVVRTLEGNTLRINCSDICYVERVGRKTKIATDSDAREIEVRSKISDIESLLPAAGFARCHNSIIVNLARVNEIHRNQVLVDGGQPLPISRGHSRGFRTKYMDWAKDRAL